ncbi:MAG: hypothetical protein AAF986_02470 [Pseudomonadota bacterium]
MNRRIGRRTHKIPHLKIARAAAISGIAIYGVVTLSTATASPWGQTGGAYIVVEQFEQYWSNADDRRFTQSTVQLYGEAGLPKKITVGGKIAYADQTIENPTLVDRPQGLTGAEVFLQRRLVQRGNSVLSTKATYAAPTKVTSALLDGKNTKQDGAVELSGLYGWSAGSVFMGGDLGYRRSLGGDADQARLHLTLGHKGRSGRLILVDLYNTFSITNPSTTGLDYDLISLSPSIVIPGWRKSKLQIGAKIDLYGRNVDPGYGAFISIWHER